MLQQVSKLGTGIVPGTTLSYDDVVLSYTGTNLTGVVYKLGTATVATLTLTYTGSRLDRVQRT